MNIETRGSHPNRLSSCRDAKDWWWGTNFRQWNGRRPEDRGENDGIFSERLWNGRDLVDLLEIDASGPGRRMVKDATSTTSSRTPRLSLLRSVRIDPPMAIRGRSPEGWARWVQPATSAMIAGRIDDGTTCRLVEQQGIVQAAVKLGPEVGSGPPIARTTPCENASLARAVAQPMAEPRSLIGKAAETFSKQLARYGTPLEFRLSRCFLHRNTLGSRTPTVAVISSIISPVLSR